jgi:hypothetical protein
MSGDWRRLPQVRGVCGGSPENHRVTRLSHKAETEDRAWLSGQNVTPKKIPSLKNASNNLNFNSKV